MILHHHKPLRRLEFADLEAQGLLECSEALVVDRELGVDAADDGHNSSSDDIVVAVVVRHMLLLL
jgi:hypothetical protein